MPDFGCVLLEACLMGSERHRLRMPLESLARLYDHVGVDKIECLDQAVLQKRHLRVEEKGIENLRSWLYHTCLSEEFVSACLRQFSQTWAASGCLTDTNSAHYVDYFESRRDKERRYIEHVIHSPEKLWVRLDILQAMVGYCRPPHLDHRRRLLTMLIYFCDSVENGMEGGSLHLHGLQETEFAPRHNLMIAFPCGPKSLHSVSEIKRQQAPRNFVQLTISSSVDAWPA